MCIHGCTHRNGTCKKEFVFVHNYKARTHGLCIPEQISAHPPVLCMDRYLWGVCLSLLVTQVAMLMRHS